MGFWITNTTVSGNLYDWTYATGTCQFSNCSTDSNSRDGVHIDATWTTGQGIGTGPCTILFTGLVNRRDGAANTNGTGTYAGLGINGTNLPVVVNGFSQMTGVSDGGTGNMRPRYGINVTSNGATPILISSGIAWGYSAGVFTSGTNTALTQANIVSITGTNYGYTT